MLCTHHLWGPEEEKTKGPVSVAQSQVRLGRPSCGFAVGSGSFPLMAGEGTRESPLGQELSDGL